MAVVGTIPAALSANNQVATLELAQEWVNDNGAWIKAIIDQHKVWIEEAEVDKFQAAYDGELESILIRDKSRGDDTNNKIFVNMAQLIIDTVTDYMIAKPPVWTVEDTDAELDEVTKKRKEAPIVEEYRKKLLKLLRKEQAQRVLAEQLRQGSIAGYSCIISWVDEKGNIDYEEFPVQEVIPVYDVRGRLIMVLRVYEVEIPKLEGGTEKFTRVEVYDDRYLTYYRSDDAGNYIIDESEVDTGNPVEHKAGRIPVSVFINGQAAKYEKRLKRNGVSDLGNGVFSILESFAAGVSDKANISEYLQDQYLKLKGVDTDEKEVIKMRKARAIALKSPESDADFIAQDQEDKTVENHLNRLHQLIYDTTFTPNLNNISGVTATEIRMKYTSLDIKAGKKDPYVVDALNQFIAILTDLLNAEKLIDAGVESPYEILSDPDAMEKRDDLYKAEWVQFTLKRNLPQNYKEIAETLAPLWGKVPDTYLYELLWFIDDPVAALDDMKAQRADEAKRGIAAMGYGGEFGNLDDNDDGDGNQ